MMRVRFLTHVTLMLGLASLVFLACLTSELYRMRYSHFSAGAQRTQSANRVGKITLSFAAPPESWFYQGPGSAKLLRATNSVPAKKDPDPASTAGADNL
jgi:hypothetical protein